MGTIMPQGELVRRALEYITETAKERNVPAKSLVSDAGMRFNLSPIDCNALERLLSTPSAIQNDTTQA